VEIAKTAKYVKRELLRSPAKTAAMSVLSIVSIVYCGPIFWSLLPISKPSPISVVVTPDSVTPEIATGSPRDLPLDIPNLGGATPVATTPAATNEKSKPSWTEIAKWIEDEPLMRPVRRGLEARNPFVEVVNKIETVLVADPDTKPTQDQPRYSVEQLGVTLRGVFVGRARMASINDEVVMEKERFSVPHPANPERMKLALELRHVDANFVVVGYQNQSFKIELNSDQSRPE
jgi:hypothetical protein